MINRVVLVGRLTKDPELKYTQSGIAVTRFTLAVNRAFSNQSGEREADFINCVTWRKQAENTANYLRKGSLTGIEGRIQTSSFDGQDGKRVFMTEVVADSVQFLEPKNSNQGQSYQEQPQQQYSQSSQPSYQQTDSDPFASNGGPVEVTDDDLPF
ncbi:single-stranded DNA-binding protein 2 [Sporosarcina sp. NCCP-2222]|uniref:single-stranded DNA-binding protein n=1 Tax=Sporosarcina sp. NCCP-2222 TaxID=2935073 RepID=UPI00208BCF0B|nr:single-stranded DNA-binding protein [Sporosarcina sp. NCCP-2222]GKV55998.1 single-stranded DNA-binding protein 2 [Sporosarcina sp. NCCP-2222]